MHSIVVRMPEEYLDVHMLISMHLLIYDHTYPVRAYSEFRWTSLRKYRLSWSEITHLEEPQRACKG
jgi:hypothetical protein